jgi:hypothetical protein
LLLLGEVGLFGFDEMTGLTAKTDLSTVASRHAAAEAAQLKENLE